MLASMRVWDIDPRKLCRKHLIGEHAEIHAVWAILTENKSGYSDHPEVKRWEGKLRALYCRHGEVVEEMKRRGFGHDSPLEERLATGKEEQLRILREKDCGCTV
jgi:hypothetical protein